MAGTTTNFAIPYPSSTDYVTDGATAMKSLADQVDAAMFTGASSGNLLINGAMQITQRSAVGTVVPTITSAGYYTADRWTTLINTMGTFSQTTLADAPAGSGFRNCLRLACTTADVSPAAGDYVIVTQKIEGQNLQAIRKGTASAQTLTLSFWVASFQTGTFIVELQDIDNSRSVSKSYTINATNTWEYKTITFPADTSGSGVLDNDSNTSLQVNFWLGAGSTYTSGTLGTTWASTTQANRAVGVSNLASSDSNKWHLTGAQLTVGSVATPFEFKSIADDLIACQRYYEKFEPNAYAYTVFGTGFAGAVDNCVTMSMFKVTKRDTPLTIDVAGSMVIGDNIGVHAIYTLSVFLTVSSKHQGGVIATTPSSLTPAKPYWLLANNNSTASLAFSSEL